MKDTPMNCKRARANIALWVGDDLDDATGHQLERHLATCPPCREHRERMQTGLTILSEVKCENTATSADSIWPTVSSRLSVCDEALRAPRFNGWVPAIAVAGIFLAIVSIASTSGPAPQFPTLVPAQPADNRFLEREFDEEVPHVAIPRWQRQGPQDDRDRQDRTRPDGTGL